MRRFSRHTAAAALALGAALAMGPLGGTQLAGSAISSGGLPPAGSTVVCTGPVTYGESENIFAGIYSFSGSVTCVSATGSTYPEQIQGGGGGSVGGLSSCVGPLWLPALTPGTGGLGQQVSLFSNPQSGPFLTMEWSGQSALGSLAQLALPSPITTGLLSSGGGSAIGSATAIWTSSTCSGGGSGMTYNITATVSGDIVMQFTVPS